MYISNTIRISCSIVPVICNVPNPNIYIYLYIQIYKNLFVFLNTDVHKRRNTSLFIRTTPYLSTFPLFAPSFRSLARFFNGTIVLIRRLSQVKFYIRYMRTFDLYINMCQLTFKPIENKSSKYKQFRY